MEQWHYLQDGQQVGPVTKEQLISLFAQQILT
ncbi:MAG: GYF domain-containing protein, partial [Planctomycetota bacterium]